MRRFLTIPVLFFALVLPACAPGDIGQFLRVTTTTITNPVDAVDIYRIKNAYAATLQLAVDWRAYCYSRPYAALMADPTARPICQNRRGTVRLIQANQPKAASAIVSAQIFVRDNPTLNASTFITAAWNAVTNFKAAIPAN